MRKTWPRIMGIGACHLLVYGYLVPCIVFPRFGRGGTLTATVLVVAVSAVLLGTAWFARNKKHKGEGHDKDRP